MMTIKRLAFSLAAAGWVSGCATPPPPPPPPPPPVESAAPAEAPEVPTGPASPAAQQQAQKLALSAVESLEAGNEEQARAELQRALASDSNNKLAHNLLRQMSTDPVAALGKESFLYIVRPGETLSKIAQRHLGDLYSFYILARYNDIKVPRQLAGGQLIRIPGKAPPPPVVKAAPPEPTVVVKPSPPEPAPPPAPTPVAVVPTPPPPPEPSPAERALRSADAAERAGDLEKALAEYRRAGDQPGAAAKTEQLRKQLVARHTVNARTAFAKQDLDGTIGQWDRVLELDPGNETAKLERRKALVLKEKLQSVK